MFKDILLSAPSQTASQMTLNHDHKEQPLSKPVCIHLKYYECSRTYLSLHGDNDDSRSTSTGTSSRVQHGPPSTSLWQLYNVHWISHTLQSRLACYIHARNRHMSGPGAVVAKESEREREQNKGKGRENVYPPTNSSSVASPCAYFFATFKR